MRPLRVRPTLECPMHIPRIWMKITADEQRPDGRPIRLTVWGWGDDEHSARDIAARRLTRLAERIRRGEPFPDKYTYGDRPLREEILDTITGASTGDPAAIITRNIYGAQILNTATLLFLDIDVQPTSGFKRFFARRSADDEALDKLRQALRQHAAATFRIYKTAAGFRALAIDRPFDPKGRDTQDLMKATGADPAFAQLCIIQNSFRARLTPKPWRCNCPVPPDHHPRDEGDARQRFAAWLTDYEKASSRHASCRYLETIGNANPATASRPLIDLHDRTTRCDQDLPLA